MSQEFESELQQRISNFQISQGPSPQVEMAEDSRNESSMQPNSGMSATRIRQRNAANTIKNRSANSSMD